MPKPLSPTQQNVSPTQQNVIDTMRAVGQDRLVRLPGGFWTYPGCPTEPRKVYEAGFKTYYVPVWYISANTIKSMERHGLLRRANAYKEAWRDERILDSESAGQVNENPVR